MHAASPSRALTNGAPYEFQVRAVNGKGAGAEATKESTPMPELNFAHFANGEQGGSHHYLRDRAGERGDLQDLPGGLLLQPDG